MKAHAFPHDIYHHESVVWQDPGMTLRDYFAAAALVGEISAQVSAAITPQEAASRAYATADAMMEARKKGGDE